MAAAGAAAKGATARRDGATSTGAGGAGAVEEALHSGGAASATAGRACSAMTIMVQINFTRPDEAELWEASPWYSDGALSNGASKEQSRLSSQPYGRRYALTCDPAEAHMWICGTGLLKTAVASVAGLWYVTAGRLA